MESGAVFSYFLYKQNLKSLESTTIFLFLQTNFKIVSFSFHFTISQPHMVQRIFIFRQAPLSGLRVLLAFWEFFFWLSLNFLMFSLTCHCSLNLITPIYESLGIKWFIDPQILCFYCIANNWVNIILGVCC